MKSIEIAGTKREVLAKRATKEIRSNKMVPCALYGKDLNVNFSVNDLEIKKAIYTPSVYIFKLNIEGTTYDAILKEIQTHPVTDALLHLDFMALSADAPVEMEIPVNIIGTSEGQRQGGKLVAKVRKLRVKALPANLPDAIDVDVTPLNIGQSVRVGDLKTEGVQFLDSVNNIIVSIRVTRNTVETPAEAAKAEAAPAK